MVTTRTLPLFPLPLSLFPFPRSPFPLPTSLFHPRMPRELPDTARQYRVAMWAFVVVALVVAVPAVQGLRGLVPPMIGLVSAGSSTICLVLAGRFGWRVHRTIVETRERESEQLGLVMLAGVLRQRTDAELESLARAEGTTGRAARLVLQRRREDADSAARRSGHHPTP